MSMQHLLLRIEKFPHIERADATFVPTAQRSIRPGNHLFLNVTYRNGAGTESAGEVLSRLRTDAKTFLTMISEVSLGEDYVFVCLSFFIAPVAGAYLRIYRITISKSNLYRIADEGLAVCEGEDSRLEWMENRGQTNERAARSA